MATPPPSEAVLSLAVQVEGLNLWWQRQERGLYCPVLSREAEK